MFKAKTTTASLRSCVKLPVNEAFTSDKRVFWLLGSPRVCEHKREQMTHQQVECYTMKTKANALQ